VEVDVDIGMERYVEAAVGATAVTRRRAEALVGVLVKQGEVAADRTEQLVDGLLTRSEHNRKALSTLVRVEAERVVERLGLARQEDVDRLAERVDRLERGADG
jgi:polyhydroxyalkanoate synthesis regulator phasin